MNKQYSDEEYKAMYDRLRELAGLKTDAASMEIAELHTDLIFPLVCSCTHCRRKSQIKG
jgi:hypothetical protein